MRGLLSILLIGSLLFAGMVSAAGGHPEILLDSGELALHGEHDHDTHPAGMLDHGSDDHCCHSVAHFTGLTSVSPSLPAPPAGARLAASAVPALSGLTYPPLPKPPRA